MFCVSCGAICYIRPPTGTALIIPPAVPQGVKVQAVVLSRAPPNVLLLYLRSSGLGDVDERVRQQRYLRAAKTRDEGETRLDHGTHRHRCIDRYRPVGIFYYNSSKHKVELLLCRRGSSS